MTMKGANFLEKLLDNQPVEWKKLGEVCNRTKGTKITAGKMKELHKEAAPIKIFAGGKTVAFVDYGDIPAKDVYTEASVIVKSRGIIEVEYYDAPFSHKAEMWSYASKSSELNIKYLYYYLKTQEFHLQKIASKMQMPQIGISDTESLEIPIPPLSVQSRIVEILDKFTALEAELEAELDCRKRQYIYYRELLLDFSQNKNIKWKKLGEVCDFQNGFAFKSSLFKEKGLPIIRITNISGGRVTDEDYKYFDSSDYPKRVEEFRVSQGDILIAMSGATTGKIGWYDNEVPAYLNQRVGRFIPNSDVLNNRFLYHYLQMKGEHLYLMAGGGAQPNLSSTDIKEKFPIPIPPLSEQQRIVEILDKFDTLTNSISEGLPLEIQLRRQQYEYYREQLLAFPHS